jgi:hypothetical protein
MLKELTLQNSVTSQKESRQKRKQILEAGNNFPIN